MEVVGLWSGLLVEMLARYVMASNDYGHTSAALVLVLATTPPPQHAGERGLLGCCRGWR
jgi:hypothetical protein